MSQKKKPNSPPREIRTCPACGHTRDHLLAIEDNGPGRMMGCGKCLAIWEPRTGAILMAGEGPLPDPARN